MKYNNADFVHRRCCSFPRRTLTGERNKTNTSNYVMSLTWRVLSTLTKVRTVSMYHGLRGFCTSPDNSDKSTTSPKLLYVERIAKLKGTCHWEKDIIKAMGLGVRKHPFTIVKNTPKTCAQLWKVKHLVKVKPVTYPYGEPTDDDVSYTEIRPTGEMIVKKELKLSDTPVDEAYNRRLTQLGWIKGEKDILWKA